MRNTGTAQMTPALALALAVTTVQPARFEEFADDLGDTGPGYRLVARSLTAWVSGPRAVTANTIGNGELHAHMAADALDSAVNSLDGSPYDMGTDGVITQLGPRTWQYTW